MEQNKLRTTPQQYPEKRVRLAAVCLQLETVLPTLGEIFWIFNIHAIQILREINFFKFCKIAKLISRKI